MYALKYRRQARNYLARLPFKIKSKIVGKFHELKANPDNSNLDIDRLKGGKGYRLRVGQYRIIYTRHEEQLLKWSEFGHEETFTNGKNGIPNNKRKWKG